MRRSASAAFLNGSNQQAKAAPSPSVSQKPDLIERLRAAAPDDRVELLEDHVRREVARVLGRDPALLIDPRQGFFQMGMDSLTSVQLTRALEAAFERSLPSTLTFNFPTLATLTAFLAKELFATVPAGATRPARGRENSPDHTSIRDSSGSGAPAASVSYNDETASEDELLELLAVRLEQVRWNP